MLPEIHGLLNYTYLTQKKCCINIQEFECIYLYHEYYASVYII